jgi:hypothetical protein
VPFSWVEPFEVLRILLQRFTKNITELITKEPSSGRSKAGKYFLRECKKHCQEQNLLKQYSEAVSMLQGHSEHNEGFEAMFMFVLVIFN